VELLVLLVVGLPPLPVWLVEGPPEPLAPVPELPQPAAMPSAPSAPRAPSPPTSRMFTKTPPQTERRRPARGRGAHKRARKRRARRHKTKEAPGWPRAPLVWVSSVSLTRVAGGVAGRRPAAAVRVRRALALPGAPGVAQTAGAVGVPPGAVLVVRGLA